VQQTAPRYDIGALDTAQILSFGLQTFSSPSSGYRVRHLLVFTRASAALQLLGALQLVKAKDFKSPLFGRCDPSAREILDLMT
jgi:hypothetical protein